MILASCNVKCLHVVFRQTLGEYSRLNDQLASDDVALCLAQWFNCGSSDMTKQWIITALLKLSPYVSNLSLLLDTLRQNSESESQEVLQVSVVFLILNYYSYCLRDYSLCSVAIERCTD